MCAEWHLIDGEGGAREAAGGAADGGGRVGQTRRERVARAAALALAGECVSLTLSLSRRELSSLCLLF